MKTALEVLKSHNLSVTKARSEILTIFLSSNKPLSIQELKDFKTLCDINESSLYRNLTKLMEVEIIRQVPSINDFSYYELTPQSSHHHHITCTSCSKIKCLTTCSIDNALSKMASKEGFSLEGHSLELYGVCEDCKKSK